VFYDCQSGETPWDKDSVRLTATTGPADCRGEGSGFAPIFVAEKPTVEVTPANSPVSICQDSPADHVDVIFTVNAGPDNLVSVPSTISSISSTDSGLLCQVKGNSDNCKYMR
jgi:hypothetical protein